MSDSSARRRALDSKVSFIVQAPAGSGKTTLLVQRLLALLAKAEQPEEIVAITFTRKAAAEMRHRVMEALQRVADGDQATQPHERLTFELAAAALKQDQALQWNLLTNGARLRVDTIDALNLWLAERLPMLSGAVAGLELVDDARNLHRQAARLCLDQLHNEDALGRSLRRLLTAFDNKAEQLENLLVTLLPRRDRWLHHLAPGQAASVLREHLEAGLKSLVERELIQAREVVLARGGLDWVPLLNHAAAHATKGQLAECVELTALPAANAESLNQWRAITEPFLKADGHWRKRVDASIGFPPAHAEAKADFKALLDSLHGDEQLLASLQAIRALPDPCYDENEWQTLLDLRQVAIHAVTQLKVIFQHRRQCDFVELAGFAQTALGELEQPSDLLLALDHRVRHILVDEFQDTSHGQFELLKKLTAGWTDNDGRTLFLVGDPMQSIYRFRDADMSLFLRAKAQRFGELSLESLVLRRNFRSQDGLVNWVNRTMTPLMPTQDDLSQGAAAFVASDGVRADAGAPALHWLVDADPAQEVEAAGRILAAELQREPDQSIAVLVQSRTHLAGLREHLAAAGIAAHAVDIEPMHRRQIIQDLIGLTRALTHRLDRVAWLAVLRAPWCGVSLAGLQVLCHDLSPDDALYDVIQDAERCELLAPDDRAALQRIQQTLNRQLSASAGKSLAAWLEECWLALGGAHCCRNERELDDAQRFFRELGVLERNEGITDGLRVARHFEEMTSLDYPTGRGVEIMTIHRAKGLEFDTVLVMGLGRALRGDDTQALRWFEMDRLEDEQPLLAPLAKAGQGSGLYHYIYAEDRARDHLELYRRLYVAVTRARDRLHLLGNVTAAGEPDGRSALARLWPAFDDSPNLLQSAQRSDTGVVIDAAPPLWRLGRSVTVAPSAQPNEELAEQPIDFEWVGQVAVLVGTAVHEWLMTISRDGVEQWNSDVIAEVQPRIRRQLNLGGVRGEALDNAANQVSKALIAALQDDRGRWLLEPHDEAESELRIALWTGNGIERLVIDRTFVAAGTRWIVDYKTSTHEGANLEGFIRSEVERYRGQLVNYAKAIRATDPRPIRVALYFPLLTRFESWEPEL
jgi:ATP-dependent helicase/nuclease subunit A